MITLNVLAQATEQAKQLNSIQLQYFDLKGWYKHYCFNVYSEHFNTQFVSVYHIYVLLAAALSHN